MVSRQFDVLWFFAPLAVAAVATLLLQQPGFMAPGLLSLFIVNAFGIGPMHQGPTWFFYFDKRNLDYWAQDRGRVMVYYVGPLIVTVVSVALAVWIPWLGLAITTLWGIQHFVQQNLGMVTLYQNKNANEAVAPRQLLSRSLWTPAIYFVSIFFYRILAPAQENVWATFAFTALGLLALVDVLRYLLDLRRQVLAGAVINLPALCFWAISILYFLPFAWPGQRIETAFLIPGTMHWCQYIGLNLILIKQKYKEGERRADIPCNASLLMALVCFVCFFAFFTTHSIKFEFASGSMPFRFFLGLAVGMSNVHYYQDAFFWRFREQYQRDSILPFLLKDRKTAVSNT